MKTEIEVISPGLFSTIQDRGRFGFMKFGVPVSGVMDSYASRICNLLLGNQPDAAVMEITFQGPQLKFHGSTKICLSGADLGAQINGVAIRRNELLKVEEGDVLKFGGRKSGFRAYLGVAGGFDTEVSMHSRSWYEDITSFSNLRKGMNLPVADSKLKPESTFSGIKVKEDYLFAKFIEAYPGHEFYQLSEEQQRKLFSDNFSLESSSNRMAIGLKEDLPNELQAIITGPVLPGTVQLTPGGNIIVLMQDCQTTGGYPRILQLSDYGKQVLSQKMPGEKIQFKRVEY